MITPATTFYCPGYLNVYNTIFHCNNPRGHGVVDLRRALANSCNVYFYQVGIRLEIGRLAKWAKLMGLGAPTGVDLPHEGSGPHAEPGVEAAGAQDALVPGRDGVGRDRAGAGERHPPADGPGRRGHRERRPPRPPPPRAGGPGRPRRGGPRRPRHPARDAGGGQGGHARGGGGGHRLAGAAADGRGVRQDGLGPGGRAARGSRSRRTPTSCCPTAGSWPSRRPTTRTIALAVLVEHGGSGGEAAAPVARQILAHFFGLDRPAAPGGRRRPPPTEAED